MTLTHMPGKLPKLAALRAMLKIESGKMDEVPGLVEEDIVAFVLEPRSPGQHILASARTPRKLSLACDRAWWQSA